MPNTSIGSFDLGVRLTSADRFQMSGELDSSLLEGVDRLLLMAGGLAVGQLVPSRPDGPKLVFCIPVHDRDALQEGEILHLAAAKGGEVVTLGGLPIATRITGALDRCNEALVRGWAANLNCPGYPLEIEVLLNGRSQGVVTADRTRSDLQRMEKRVAATGFLFKFTPPIDVSAAVPLEVTARVRGTDIVLANSPWWIRRSYDVLPVLTVHHD
ncbi:hypothetical protein [Muricoccus pecuniae]|uniref:Uncharacterized protein n=1 Tax=Muricoccus pecuniae TaxID=693023 RepID=A0A840YEY0_9PROT|nr:hypothetical protein [Roseomonas pecuniae]MBB5693052.1 hypothetical protein [Roseomonas pecuniae]